MKNISFIRNGKEFEPTKDELKRVLDDYAERLALTEKALELACECFYNNFVKTIEPYCECCTSPIAMKEHFKTKAKEMIKSE